MVRDQGVGGSNPLSPTKFFKIKYLQAQEIRFRRLFHRLQVSSSKSYAIYNQRLRNLNEPLVENQVVRRGSGRQRGSGERSNMAFAGDFTSVLAKHSKSFSLIDCISTECSGTLSRCASRWKLGKEAN